MIENITDNKWGISKETFISKNNIHEMAII